MTREDYQALLVGERVLVHDPRRRQELLRGTVISTGRFDRLRPGVHVGVKILATNAILHPTWERIHHYPLDRDDRCRFCGDLRAD